jgi:hypothetical protein
MKKQLIHRREALRTVAIGGVAAGVWAAAGPTAVMAKEIDVAKVPAAITAAADRLLKGAKWTTAYKGKESYDLDGAETNGTEVSVEVTTDGKVISVDRAVAVKDVPKVATKAATDKIPTFKAEHAYELYDGDDIKDLEKAERSYELEGTSGKKKQVHEVTITVTADGKVTEVKTEIELKAVPKAVLEALTQKSPKFKAATAHKVEEGDSIGYLLGEDPDKDDAMVAYVSADGKDVELLTDDD